MDPIASLHLRVDQIEGMLRQVLDAQQTTKRADSSEWMNTAETCRALGCSESQLRRARNNGVLNSNAVVNVAMGSGRPTYRFHRTKAPKQYFNR